MENLILMTDSYKASHWKQYPPKTTKVFSYIEARGGGKETVFFGLQYLLKKHLTRRITQEMIDEADRFFALHGEPFNKEGWEYILNEHDGKLPVVIKAVPEGRVVPVLNALVTIENTDPKCYWLTSYLETILIRGVWYPTTVATNSYIAKEIIMRYLKKTCDDPEAQIPFKLHDFGGRGVSSGESAEIGGAAHLVNFMGSDTVEGVWAANKYYNADMAAFSIPAAEHSTITVWGRENEIEAYRNMLKQFAAPGKIVAVVSDSYDIYKAARKLWGTDLREEVLKTGATIVIRPDSGNPTEVVEKLVGILGDQFGFTINKKGFRVLNPAIRVIQGDGIKPNTIEPILYRLEAARYSTENVAFGMGGGLLQECNRDTFKFAMKCSYAEVDGKPVDVFKDPITDPGKVSKKGRITLIEEDDGFHTIVENGRWYDKPALVEVFRDGIITREYTLNEVRDNVKR